ncbi:MAG: aminopeptidase [Gemmatimonadaceae bacterium]
MFRWVGLAIVALSVTFIAMPTGRYLLRGAWEEGKILLRRRPIPRVIADTATDVATRSRLQLVLDARTFAARDLALRAGESFTTYTPLEHDTLVLVVSAAPRDRLVSYTWWFPIVGRVPYKGFFDFHGALALAEQLQKQSMDTYVRPASALSTLGWFNDPLLSTTLELDTLSLANTVIHELTHNTVFVPSQVTFNESLASFVGGRGAVAFFRARGSTVAATRAERRWEDEKLMASFWSAAQRAIDSAFAAHPDDQAARLTARDTVYAHLRRVLMDDLAPSMRTYSPKSLERIPLDNASLLAHKVYAADLWLFDEVLTRNRGDLRRSVAVIARIARGAKDPFAALHAWLETSGPSLTP